MSRQPGSKNTMPYCTGSGEPMCGNMDRCLDCGRVYDDDMNSIIDPKTGLAKMHLPVSKKKRRQMGLIGMVALSALCLAGCGDHPVPERGFVTDAKFTRAWTQVIPGNTFCSGTPPSCYTTPPQIINWPDEWRLEITAENNPDWVGTVEVSEKVYGHCNLRELWPICSQEGSGDERV